MKRITRKCITSMLVDGVALPLKQAVNDIESETFNYYDFECLYYCCGVYGISGVVVRNNKNDKLYATNERDIDLFYFC